jgi:hypothetical protein
MVVVAEGDAASAARDIDTSVSTSPADKIYHLADQTNHEPHDNPKEMALVTVGDAGSRRVVNMLLLHPNEETINEMVVTDVTLPAYDSTYTRRAPDIVVADLEKVTHMIQNFNLFVELTANIGDNASTSSAETPTLDDVIEEPIEYELQNVEVRTNDVSSAIDEPMEFELKNVVGPNDDVSSVTKPDANVGIEDTVRYQKIPDQVEITAITTEDTEMLDVYDPITNIVNEDLVIPHKNEAKFELRQPKGFEKKSILELMREFGDVEKEDTIIPFNEWPFFGRSPLNNWIDEQLKNMRKRLKINGRVYLTIAVRGDGHCGYHSLAMGLDYLGLFRFVTRKADVHMFLGKY